MEEYLIGLMLIYLIGELRLLSHRWKKVVKRLNEGAKAMGVFNHRITLIETRLKTCGIVELEAPPEQPPIPGMINMPQNPGAPTDLLNR